ncbi:MAG: ArnT family glycosyltransferase, partial [Chloroflexota bacterium]
MPLSRHRAWIVLILLIASFLRLHDLPHVPPGMTHDEADHGLDAWGVVQGERPIYFTVGYGREPLYDYSTAVLMTFMGPTFLAGRLTSVFFSLILIAGSYSLLRRAFGENVALLSAAGLTLGSWPLMTARQALRSGALPALLVVAVGVFWRGLLETRDWGLEIGDWRLGIGDWGLGIGQSLISNLRYLFSGALLGLTFYTYIPSRVLWLLFPGLAIYWWLQGRRGVWRGTLLALGVAALVALPLFSYLMANPGVETRIGQLALPLQQAAQGEFELLWRNARSGLGIFTVAGDSQWRYNVAGKPLLSPIGGSLFYASVLYSAWRALSSLRGRRRGSDATAGHFLMLLWLALGLAPVLVTGRELST